MENDLDIKLYNEYLNGEKISLVYISEGRVRYGK